MPLSSHKIVLERWFIVAILFLLSFQQSLSWDTWGPITLTVTPLLEEWGVEDIDATIALFANWGPICFLIAFLPSSWLLDTQGLRKTMIITASLVFAGAFLRLFCFLLPSFALPLVHFAQILNALAGPVAMAAPPLISSLWFPINHRTVATSVMTGSSVLGAAFSFLIGPLLVPYEHQEDYNVGLSPEGAALHLLEIKGMVNNYLKLQFWFSLLILVLTIVYFTDRPRYTDAVLGDNKELAQQLSSFADFYQSLTLLVRHKNFWVIALAYGTMTGVYAGWGSFLTPNLAQTLPTDIVEDVSMYMGFYATLLGGFGGILFGWFADNLGRNLRSMLIVMSSLSVLFAAFFLFFCAHATKYSLMYLYATSIIDGFFINSTIPLFYEYACDAIAASKINMGSATCLLTALNNLGCLSFLVIANFSSSLPSSWENWALLLSCVVALVLVIYSFERGTRNIHAL